MTEFAGGQPLVHLAKGPRLGAAAALILPLLLSGCLDLFGEPSRDQVAWAKSPDGLTHAILIETNGGATTPYGYLVELHPADHRGETPIGVARLVAASSRCARGVELHWLDANTLALRYGSARDVVLSGPVSVGGKTIRIVARKFAANAAAPCGGSAR
ncbi:hypothetical protein OF829_01195 [Sphingomonas sp. LB-2]|uniref:hypothetical protein n=1 Tax=Sphingomonas caeni TaxID=2984949 RepID=UPI00222F68E3|nr:hypothetical protein [Sphingomonas caeni]MCW3845838.1 hypothetical protein [Sphingomonas caeni]